MKFPRATLQDQKDGWTIDVEYLCMIVELTQEHTHPIFSAETIESVLLALEAIQEEVKG